MLFDSRGRVVASAQREFEQIFPKPGWVEHDPQEIMTSVLVTLTEVMHNAGVDASRVAGIGITNQRETTVVWDRETGEPVHNAIVWQSRHSAEICRRMRSDGVETLIRERTGLLLDAYFSGTKTQVAVRERRRGARAGRTGRAAVRHHRHLADLEPHRRQGARHRHHQRLAHPALRHPSPVQWDEDLLELFDVPASMLPQVRSCSETYGHIQPRHFHGHDVPICGIAGDQQAALFGQACFTPGMAKNTYGTGCFLLMHTGDEARTSTHGLLTTPAWKLGGNVEYALEGSIFVAGSVVQWLRDGLRMLRHAGDSEAYAERADDNDGVYLVPAFTGLGAPYWQSDVRGAVFGLTRGTSKEHFIRAALESMAYQTRDVLDAMQADAGIELAELRADGGAIANDFLAQFQADMLGVPVVRPSINETTALGAAYLAGLAAGIWRDREEIAGLWSEDARFTATMPDDRRDQLYAGWRKAVEATMAFRVDD